MEPRQVTSPDGLKRWVGADGKSYETFEAAKNAKATSEECAPKVPSPLRLFHVTADSGFLQWPKSAWLKAETPKRAVSLWLQSGGGGRGNINVYDYLWNWHGTSEREGGATLEYPGHRVAVFNEEEQRELWDEIRRGEA